MATYGQLNADNLTSSTGGVISPNITSLRNRIINGAMVIDQRDSGASVTNTTSLVYSIDRWANLGSVASKFTVQQNAGSVTLPTGYINYLGVTSSSAYSVPTGELYNIRQIIEGLNITDLAWGTANAKTVTLSFWVYSSLTGTFGGSLINDGFNYSYPFSYSIPVANTWTQISLTITGPTSGTWLTTNGRGIIAIWSLGTGATYSGTAGSWSANNYQSATGATSVVGTSGATFYITGVQLEVGAQATSFDYRPYGTELALCQRYYETSFTQGVPPSNSAASVNNGTHQTITCYSVSGGWISGVYYKVPKRIASLSVTTYSFTGIGSGGLWAWYTTGWNTLSTTSVDYYSDTSFGLSGTSSSSFTANTTYITTGAWAVSAEL